MEEQIGVVQDYFAKIGVAAIELTAGRLAVGDKLHFKGHTSDFEQVIASMQIEHQNVETAKTGDSIGVKVDERARKGDLVFKVTE